MTLNDLYVAEFDFMRSFEGFHFEFDQKRPLNDIHHVLRAAHESVYNDLWNILLHIGQIRSQKVKISGQNGY